MTHDEHDEPIFLGLDAFGEWVLLERPQARRNKVPHVTGRARLGRPHHLLGRSLPPWGDGGNPGLGPLCHPFLKTDPPRLLWLSSSAKTQQHTKKAIHRLTGRQAGSYQTNSTVE